MSNPSRRVIYAGSRFFVCTRACARVGRLRVIHNAVLHPPACDDRPGPLTGMVNLLYRVDSPQYVHGRPAGPGLLSPTPVTPPPPPPGRADTAESLSVGGCADGSPRQSICAFRPDRDQGGFPHRVPSRIPPPFCESQHALGAGAPGGGPGQGVLPWSHAGPIPAAGTGITPPVSCQPLRGHP